MRYTYAIVIFIFVFGTLLPQLALGQKQGQALIDSLVAELPRLKEDTNKVNVLHSLSYNLAGWNPDMGILYSREGLELAKKINWQKGVARHYTDLGIHYNDKADFTQALEYHQIALKIFTIIQWERGIGSTLLNIGNVYNAQNKYKDALEYYGKSLKTREAIGDKKDVAVVLRNIGNVLHSMGDFAQAMQYCQRALTIYESISDGQGKAATLKLMGILGYSIERMDLAVEYTKKAVQVYREMGDSRNLCDAQANLGQILLRTNDTAGALECYRQVEKNINSSQNAKMTVLEGMGQILCAQNKSLEGIKCFRKGLELSEEAKNDYNSSLFYTDISVAYLFIAHDQTGTLSIPGVTREKAAELSIEYALKGLELNKKIGAKGLIKDNYAFLSDAYGLIGRYKEALEYLRLHNDVVKEVYTEDNSRTVAQLHEQYEAEKKDAEIKILARDKTLQQLQLKEQQASLFQQILLAKQRENQLALSNQAKAIKDLELEKNRNLLGQKELLITSREKDMKLLNKEKAIQAATIRQEKTIKTYMASSFLLLLAFAGISVYNYNRRKKLAFSKQVSETEMKALRAQMNPHFIFNSLNTIHSFVQANENKAASEYLLKFSSLTREILENSQHQLISLADELRALETYLSLEAMRLNKKLEYEVVIDPSLEKENTMVPPLIVQPFIENAVLHGLQQKDGDGRIKIIISRQGEMLNCLIEDNGVGLQQSANTKKGGYAIKKESLGMKLTEQRIDIINKLKKSKGFVSVTEKLDERKQPAGVKVELMLPLEERF